MLKYIPYPFLFLLLISLNTSLLYSQNNTFLSKDQIDPDAKLMLDKMTEKLNEMEIMVLDFELSYYMPDGAKFVNAGKVVQQGNKYRLNLEDQEVVSDGNYNYVYLKKRNEVQINDLDESSSFQLSPSFLLDFHNSGDFVYAITGEQKNDKGTEVRIDFKSLDEFNPFSKVGIDLDKKSYLPSRLVVINKDAGRYIFDKIRISELKEIEKDFFIFNISAYPGIYVEDLRLD